MMIYTFEYTNGEVRESIIQSNKDKYLIEEKNISEGNFLIFTSVKPLEVEIDELKSQSTELMLAVAELGSTNAKIATETQLALAELSILVVGGDE